MAWNDIIGQERTKTLIRSIISSGKIPHAWMFTGPEGVGKSVAALEIAKVLACQSQDNDDSACDTCASCRAIDDLQSASVQLIFPLPTGKNESSRTDGPFDKLSEDDLERIRSEIDEKASDKYHRISIPKAQQIKVSSIRQIRRDTSKSSDSGSWRVFVILDAERMGVEAANAFLKTLEEPTGNTLVILVTKDPARILPTIRSRCQQVRFAPLAEAEIQAALVERHNVQDAEARLISRLSEGSFTRATELLGTELRQLRSDAVDFLRGVLRRSPVAASEQIERLAGVGDRNELDRFLGLLELWLRDATLLYLTDSDEMVVNSDQTEDLRRFVSRFGRADMHRMATAVEDARYRVRRNVQPRLALTSLCMNIERYCYSAPDRKSRETAPTI